MTFRSNKTVLVLGAGASYPYGFPLGGMLKSGILSWLGDKAREEWRALQSLGFTEDEIFGFKRDLEDAYLHGTIDEYLRHKPSRRRIGTRAIAVVLSALENPNKVFKTIDWYADLARGLRLHESGESPISGVITFNYERSLQFVLERTAKENFEGDVQRDAMAKVSSIPFVHVHGSLGKLSKSQFYPAKDPATLEEAAESISLVHDDALTGSKVFEDARALLAEAKEIYIIGWGFDRKGIDRLGLLDINRKRVKMAATAHGLSNRDEIANLFGQEMYLPAMDAAAFMKDMNHRAE